MTPYVSMQHEEQEQAMSLHNGPCSENLMQQMEWQMSVT